MALHYCETRPLSAKTSSQLTTHLLLAALLLTAHSGPARQTHSQSQSEMVGGRKLNKTAVAPRLGPGSITDTISSYPRKPEIFVCLKIFEMLKILPISISCPI